MKLSGSNIKKFLIFSQKKALLLFQETEIPKKISYMLFREIELPSSTLEKLLISQERTCKA